MAYYVLIFSLVLLQINLLFEGTMAQLVKLGALLPFWLVVMNALATKTIKVTATKLSKLLFFYLFLILIAIFRAFIVESLTTTEMMFILLELTTLIFFGLTAFSAKSIKESKKMRLGIFYALLIYVFVNVLLFAMGFRSPLENSAPAFTSQSQTSVLLPSLGFDIPRALFPLAGGYNNFGVIAGAALLIGLLMIFSKKTQTGPSQRLLIIMLTFVSLVAVLLSDTRGALIFAILSLLIVINYSRVYKIFPYLPFVAPVIPLLIMTSIFEISQWLWNLNFVSLSELFRNTFDIQQVAGRYKIWQSAFNELSNFSFVHLFGYGLYGQAESGVSYGYYNLARHFLNPEKVSLHNSFIQHIFDIGYLGLMIFILMISQLMKTLANHKKVDNAFKMTSALLLYLLFTSFSEVSISIYFKELLAMFMFMIFATNSASEKEKRLESEGFYA